MSKVKNYLISSTLNNMVNTTALDAEIRANSTLSNIFDGINKQQGNDNFDIYYSVDRTTEIDSATDAIVAAHSGNPLVIKDLVEVVQQPAFTAKVLSNGGKLFKRVHGVKVTVNNETKNIELVVPYNACKVTGVEFIGASIGDTANLKVLDTPSGAITSTLAATGYTAMPNFMLNQFGFDVNIAQFYHEETSSYDADLIKDMKIVIEYTTAEPTKQVGVNFVLHEVK